MSGTMYKGVEEKLQAFLNFVTGKGMKVISFAIIALQYPLQN